MKISTIVKGSICLLGLVGAGNFLAAPAHADQAAARAAVSITRPSGVTESVSGEALLPTGLQFGGIVDDGGTLTTADDVTTANLEVTPSYAEDTEGTTGESLASLSFNAGEAVANSPNPGTLAEAVIAILNGTNETLVIVDFDEDDEPIYENRAVNVGSADDAAAIIKAAVGVNGLD